MSKKINLNLSHTEHLPTPHDILHELPISLYQQSFVEASRRKITETLLPHHPRLLLIVGPCSIHDPHAAIEYALKLRGLAQQVSDMFLVVMRVYFEKPRTTVGWKGLLYDPHLDDSNDLPAGIRLTRKLLLDLADLEIPTAAEFLDPFSCYYFSDLISWACIGARTSESQTHRQMASALPMPVAFKNNTNGCIDVAVNGILSASTPHAFMGVNDHGQMALMRSKGNTHCHIALRGGDNKPNYDPQSIAKALYFLQKHGLPKRVLIDCSHDNSNRQHEQQVRVFESIIHQILEGECCIRGMILESNLQAGNQALTSDRSKLRYAVSLTDPCLDWSTTERLILWGHEMLSKENIYLQKLALTTST